MRISDWSSDVCSSDLGIVEGATTPTFAAVLAAHRDQCPAGELELFEMPSAAQPPALRRGEIDVGLLLSPVPSDGLQLDELRSEGWLVAMPSDHRLADYDMIAISDLAGERFVAAHQEFGPGCHQQPQRSEEHTSELQSLMRIS